MHEQLGRLLTIPTDLDMQAEQACADLKGNGDYAHLQAGGVELHGLGIPFVRVQILVRRRKGGFARQFAKQKTQREPRQILRTGR